MNLPEKELKRLYELKENNVKLLFDTKTLKNQTKNDPGMSKNEKYNLLKLFNEIEKCCHKMLDFHNLLEKNGELTKEELKNLRMLLNQIDRIR